MVRRPRKRLIVVVAVLSALVLSACGGDSTDHKASTGTRTVEVEMRDIAFSPKRIDVASGEKVRFVFRNTGTVAHDAFIGDEDAQKDHEMEMAQPNSGGMAGMDHNGGDDDAITVQPGKTGDLTHAFASGDDVLIGCHQSGHYAAGMKLTVQVS